MGAFSIERTVAAPPPQVWQVVTDWAGYGRWMPMTRMRLDPGPTRVGWSFAGLTGVGRLSFADSMRITDWAPPTEAGTGPGAFRVVKTGRLLAGWAEVRVVPLADGRQTRLLWREDIVVRPSVVGRLLAPVTDLVSRVLFTKVINDMAAEAVRISGHPSSKESSENP